MMSQSRGQNTILTRLQEIDRFDFEDFVSDIFEVAGWETNVTQHSDDGGVDVIARKNTLYEEKASIQAKRPDRGNKVGKPAVLEYSALDRNDIDTDVVVIATTAPFTRDGYRAAVENNVKLIDGAMLAGFVEAQDASDLVDDYAPDIDEIELGGDEVFSTGETARDEYLRERPVSASVKIFRQKSLIDAVDLIQNSEVGKDQIDCLYELKSSIDNGGGDIPINSLLNYPQLIDQNWHNIRYLDEVCERVSELSDGGAVTPDEFDLLCFQYRETVSIQTLLPTDVPVEVDDFAFLETCVDCIAELEVVDDDNPDGLILGYRLDNLDGKIQRNKHYGITAKTYQEILERSIRANDELLRAVKPYFRASNDEETLEKINLLREMVN